MTVWGKMGYDNPILEKRGEVMADQENTIILTDDEGHEHEFIVVDVLNLEDDEYAILLPAENADGNDEAVVLKIGLDEDGNEILYEIDDEEEWQRVARAWEDAVAEEDGEE
ncbi:DUF1292 domain-containing protein [Neomoorella thermoacetica]|uniref:Uncharacterized protein n=3 Tax=Neomoorella thermoacetica TaxID=1525 RepID=A0A1D7XBT1_NEOTH|nr:DUF1292 domain-containing protein [Moorella thermoacetica]AKX94438.1 hypothetical protein MOTHE_c16450 [Moorella thermoacetica]AKX97074.1 hypothetical protein MOTHA_c17280 [Moorella thermoacetica]AOQ24376.1 hypothetical protein Maut_01939 [Moorella thermoacetica]OIQ08433.1 hypothetical protein MOOR_19760 [Moorella thermoacetica]OIQ55220.1 hypothetical protein MORE_09750 [Moorella thermoacetica]